VTEPCQQRDELERRGGRRTQRNRVTTAKIVPLARRHKLP